jgi:hypothetical protein
MHELGISKTDHRNVPKVDQRDEIQRLRCAREIEPENKKGFGL